MVKDEMRKTLQIRKTQTSKGPSGGRGEEVESVRSLNSPPLFVENAGVYYNFF
jgi:hypothetical protein